MKLIELAQRAEKRDLTDQYALSDYFDAIRLLESEDFEAAHRMAKTARNAAAIGARTQFSSGMMDIYRRCLLFDAPHEFDAYCQYLEWNRPSDKKFYMPRRKQLKTLASALQELAERKIELCGRKSLGIFMKISGLF